MFADLGPGQRLTHNHDYWESRMDYLIETDSDIIALQTGTCAQRR